MYTLLKLQISESMQELLKYPVMFCPWKANSTCFKQNAEYVNINPIREIT